MLTIVEGDLALLTKRKLISPNSGLSAYWPPRSTSGTNHIFVVSDSTLNFGKRSKGSNWGFEWYITEMFPGAKLVT